MYKIKNWAVIFLKFENGGADNEIEKKIRDKKSERFGNIVNQK